MLVSGLSSSLIPSQEPPERYQPPSFYQKVSGKTKKSLTQLVSHQGLSMGGRPDLNRRPPDPQSSDKVLSPRKTAFFPGDTKLATFPGRFLDVSRRFPGNTFGNSRQRTQPGKSAASFGQCRADQSPRARRPVGAAGSFFYRAGRRAERCPSPWTTATGDATQGRRDGTWDAFCGRHAARTCPMPFQPSHRRHAILTHRGAPGRPGRRAPRRRSVAIVGRQPRRASATPAPWPRVEALALDGTADDQTAGDRRGAWEAVPTLQDRR
jgi:hypothetical protein